MTSTSVKTKGRYTEIEVDGVEIAFDHDTGQVIVDDAESARMVENEPEQAVVETRDA